jgi:hypothetical protein
MRKFLALSLLASLLFVTALPAQAEDAGPKDAHAVKGQLLASTDATPPIHMDKDLALEHERFTSFARGHVQRMNANIIGGKHSMNVRKGHDGMFRATYKAIDTAEVVCQVRRADHDPSYFVGVIIFKEQVLESVAKNANDCRNGSFQPVAETAHRVIFSSKRGGGWH